MQTNKEPNQTLAASMVQAYLYDRFGEYALVIACNPFKNYSDVRERVETFFNGRLKAAAMCVNLKHKGTKSLQVYVCS
ncbi:hypothetical protein [Vibrio sp. TBV020]|uniref:hypothetical protein n=1 Tax=Vibrio sp. TBV020 TaxID=3137398 RepID=UPI0038CD717A